MSMNVQGHRATAETLALDALVVKIGSAMNDARRWVRGARAQQRVHTIEGVGDRLMDKSARLVFATECLQAAKQMLAELESQLGPQGMKCKFCGHTLDEKEFDGMAACPYGEPGRLTDQLVSEMSDHLNEEAWDGSPQHDGGDALCVMFTEKQWRDYRDFTGDLRFSQPVVRQ